MVASGITVEGGRAQGNPMLLSEPLSFWGGFDALRGVIVERGHPEYGRSLQGRVVLMERAKGSSSSSSVLAEALRHGVGPSAMVMRESDLIVALGAIVARELYGVTMPIVVVDASTWERLTEVNRTLNVLATEGGRASVTWTPSDT
jgi:predicted aconitase with swiveling domain